MWSESSIGSTVDPQCENPTTVPNRDQTAVVEVSCRSRRGRATSKTTTDHDVIRRWAEERGGVPASVESTTGDSGEAGILRIEFRDDQSKLDEVEWDQFFRTFDDRKLAFLYQERTSDGQLSRFNKFVSR